MGEEMGGTKEQGIWTSRAAEMGAEVIGGQKGWSGSNEERAGA